MTLTPDEQARAAARRRRAALLALLGCSLVLNLVPVWWGLPTGWSWAFDEIHPRHVLEPAAWPSKYPPFHRYLLAVVYAPFQALVSSGALSLDGAGYGTLLFVVGRAVSAVLATAIVYLLYRIGRRWLGPGGALLAAAATAFSPTFLYYAKTMNLEIPYLFWFVLSMLFFLRALRDGKMRDFILLAVTGVLSFCTKDQAAAFYVLVPFALAASLAARQDPGRGRLRRYLTAFFDRRMLSGAAVATLLVVLIYKGFSGAEELRRHLAVLAAPSWEDYRPYSLTLGGQLRMGLQTLANLWFILGGPLFAAAAVGLALALRAPRAHRELFALFLLLVPYYSIPLVMTGFSYDRHLICFGFVLSFFAARALRPLLAPRRFRAAATATLVLVLGYSLARGASVDLMMLGDARYETERWIRSGLGGKTLLGLGNKTLLPRGIAVVDSQVFRPRLVGEGLLPPGAYHDCWMLATLNADYLVVDQPAVFDSPGVNYEADRIFRNPLPFQLLRFGAVATNLDKIATEVVVFRRTEAECREQGRVPRMLVALSRRPDAEARAALARTIAESPAAETLPLHEDLSVVAGVTWDYFTRGKAPAGIVVTNPEAEPLELELSVASQAPPEEHPITLLLDDGESTRRHVFDAPGGAWIGLSPVPPGSRRLFILWSDKEWRATWEPLPFVRGLKLWPQTRADRERRRRERALAAAVEAISRLRTRRDPQARSGILAAAAAGKFELLPVLGRRLTAFNLTGDYWTRGGAPVGLVMRNRGERRFAAQLKIACNLPPASLPARIFLEDGRATRAFDCRPPGRLRIDLPPTPPGGERLFVLWTDAEWSPGDDDPRRLGVRLVPTQRGPKEE